MYEFYAVGWDGHSRQVKNFRKADIKKGFGSYIEQVYFSNNSNDITEQLSDKKMLVSDKFQMAITSLANVETNGNDTNVPFFRTINVNLKIESSRCSKVTEQLYLELPALTNLEQIRFYILIEEKNDVVFRYYIKALRTVKLSTRFILTHLDGAINITDTKNEGKTLPFSICYVERIKNNNITQYIFNVQDYEEMFGLNEAKIELAKSNLKKFSPDDETEEPEFRMANKFLVKIVDGERDKIFNKIDEDKGLCNLLSKYNDEANDFNWEDIKKANEAGKIFDQVPFDFNEQKGLIYINLDSFKCWVSVISNTKKRSLAKNELEDKLATKRKKNLVQNNLSKENNAVNQIMTTI